EVVREESADAVAQLVADRSPCARHLEVTDVMRHEARARTEDRKIESSPAHDAELVRLDRFAQLVVADAELGRLRHLGGIRDTGNLAVAPRLERLGRGCI